MNLLSYFLLFIITFSVGRLESAQNISNEQVILKGDIFTIQDNFSTSRQYPSKGQVFYFMPGDAYRNLQAKRFQDWSNASVDARNLYRVLRDDSIEVLGFLFNDQILEVKLLNGLDKGRVFYAIRNEIQQNFIEGKEHADM